MLAVLSVGLVVLAALLITAGVRGQRHAPTPPAAEGVASPVASVVAAGSPGSTMSSSSPAAEVTAPAGPPPRPVAMTITIAKIRVHAVVTKLGLNADHTVQVPPLNKVGEAGWYKYSPLPGNVGPSVILGHIDSAVAGRGVFFNLGDLRRGDIVSILRPDRMLARFTVTRLADFPKTAFPTQQVYGYTPFPVLRLVTCGGHFDRAAGSYDDNIIAFASLTSLQQT